MSDHTEKDTKTIENLILQIKECETIDQVFTLTRDGMIRIFENEYGEANRVFHTNRTGEIRPRKELISLRGAKYNGNLCIDEQGFEGFSKTRKYLGMEFNYAGAFHNEPFVASSSVLMVPKRYHGGEHHWGENMFESGHHWLDQDVLKNRSRIFFYLSNPYSKELKPAQQSFGIKNPVGYALNNGEVIQIDPHSFREIRKIA